MENADFKLIFTHHDPREIQSTVSTLVQGLLRDPYFYMEDGALIGVVGSPKMFNEIDEEEPRIEYLLAIRGGWKHVLILFILEHMMNVLRDRSQRQRGDSDNLEYRVLFPASAASGVHLKPFKRHFSSVDEFWLKEVSFGNVLGHNQLIVRRRIQVSDQIGQVLKINKHLLPRVPLFRNANINESGAAKRQAISNGGSSVVTLNNGKAIADIPNGMITSGQDRQDSGFCEDNYTVRDRTPSPKSFPSPTAESEKNFIIAEFEHDLRILNLRFLNPYSTRRESWKVLDQIRLLVKYESIKHIHLQLEKRTPKTFWAQLLLRLKFPPQIWRVDDVFGLRNARQGGTDRRRQKGRRMKTWGADKNFEMAHDIAHSPVLVLNFNETSPQKLSIIIGRLLGLLKVDLDLRNITEWDINASQQFTLPHQCYSDFDLFYWFEALSSRGFACRDHWLDDSERSRFSETVVSRYKASPRRTLNALEILAERMWDRLEVRHPRRLLGMFEDIERELLKNVVEHETLPADFVRLKKVIITPSRIILCGNEVLLGNRVLRFDPIRYPSEKFLRIVFRDDDGQRVHRTNIGDSLINTFIDAVMRGGITICEKPFYFLGTSNSQMRDGGCYFLQAELDEVAEFRKNLGQFERMPSIPKMMSRLGLCFTQGRETNLNMDLQMLGFDFIGGKNTKGESYVFSDGCGCMSLAAAKQIAKELELDPQNPPSCFQFRYAGYKGVLSVNPTLDAAEHLWESCISTEKKTRDQYLAVDFYFRPSQKKFDIQLDQEGKCRFEVVKYSAPSQIFLNKPLINILDQVSMFHSVESHERICNRIHTLLDRHMFSLCATLTDELAARKRLQELPRLVEYGLLKAVHFTQEPFFRLVLRAAAKVSMFKLRQKLAIAIPNQLGRVMFGVVDETDTLQYGQVFVQYSKGITPISSNKRVRNRLGQKIIVKGKVLISKNPAIVGGDVRIYTAVDVPGLRHLVDVLVFPRFGPRPHSDEMAGSDLDGDEYGVFWDPELAFERNEPAADYTPMEEEVVANKDDQKDFHDKMVEFFVNYVKHDSIGRIANAHLVNSDLYGLRADVCAGIAQKHQQAVDFPKSGKPSAPLTYNWTGENPPERSERAPDFMEKDAAEPQYISGRLNGQLYRRVNEFSNFVSSTIVDESRKFPHTEALFLSRNEHGEYLLKAQQHYNFYSYKIRRLMDAYGIQCEGELFSFSYSVLRNRLSDRENDDMSFFNTTYIIEQLLWDIARSTRARFFSTFGSSIERLTDCDGVCVDPSRELQLLARAYYTIAYYSSTRQLFSFPWVACWDVMDTIRRLSILEEGVRSLPIDPFADRLLAHIHEFEQENKKKLGAFRKRLTSLDGTESSGEYELKCLLFRYIQRHKGFLSLLFFSSEWARKQKVFEQSPLREEHIFLLLLESELKRGSVKDTPRDWQDCPKTPTQEISSLLGKSFSSFLEALASWQFERRATLDFQHLGLECEQHFLANGEWRMLHQVALSTYQHLVFAERFSDVLPSADDKTDSAAAIADESAVETLEGPGFQLEMPPVPYSETFVKYYKLLDRLCEETGCERILMRRHPRYSLWRSNSLTNGRLRAMRIIVTSWGTRSALLRLRQLLAIRPKKDLAANQLFSIRMIPETMMEMLSGLLDGGRRDLELTTGNDVITWQATLPEGDNEFEEVVYDESEE